MTSRSSAFLTVVGDTRIPINAAAAPGIDETLIAKNNEMITLAQLQVATRIRNNAKKTEEVVKQEAARKAALAQRAYDIACNPDICRCRSGQRCHLNMHRHGHLRSRHLVTRGSVHCAGC